MQKSTYFDQTTTQQELQTKMYFQACTNSKQLAARAVMTEFHVRTNIAAQLQKGQIVLWETRSFLGKTFSSFHWFLLSANSQYYYMTCMCQ